MLFEFNLYSSLLLIFFVHILVYGFLFAKRSRSRGSYADGIMAIFMLLSAMLTIPFMVGFAGWYDTQPYRDFLFFVPLTHTLLLGPLLYFYTRSVFDFRFKIQTIQYLHFLPGVLYLIYCLADTLINLYITHNYQKTSEREDPDFDQWYVLLSMASTLIYLYLSIRYYGKYKRYALIATSFADQASARWLRNFLYAFATLCSISIVKSILSNFEFFNRMRYFGPWYYYLAFAIIVYYIAVSAYSAGILPLYKMQFEPQLLDGFENSSRESEHHEPQQTGAFDTLTQQTDAVIDEKITIIASQLTALMENEKLFERTDLTLADTAQKLGSNSVLLSKAVNQRFGMNFNDYVNQYRTHAVIERIKLQENKNLTLLAIAYQAGFNSKATFNRAFKKFTGKNPKEFLK